MLKDAVNAKATPNQRAAIEAAVYCRRPGWTRICDMTSDEFAAKVYKTFDELDEETRKIYIDRYGEDADEAYLRWGRQHYRVPVAYVLDDGTVVDLEQFRAMELCGRGFMMVVKLCIGGEAA